MSHKVHPYSHRLGIIRDWQSRWFVGSGQGESRRGQYQEYLRADVLLRQYLEKRLRGLFVKAVEIERGQNSVRLIIRTARPGMLIGRSGEGSAKLKKDVIAQWQRLGVTVPKDFRLDIEEVKHPESHGKIAAQMVAEGLEKRFPFKKAMRQTMDKIMANKQVLGARITIAGRLGGAEIARTETIKKGRLPLQTLRADVDFAREKAYLPYGVIGIKVWIYRGDIFSAEGGSA